MICATLDSVNEMFIFMKPANRGDPYYCSTVPSGKICMHLKHSAATRRSFSSCCCVNRQSNCAVVTREIIGRSGGSLTTSTTTCMKDYFPEASMDELA